MLAELKSAGADKLCARLSVPLITHCEYRELQQCGGGGLIVHSTNFRPVCAPVWHADVAVASESGIFRMYFYDSQWKIACLWRPDSLSYADLQMSLQRTPYLAFWTAWGATTHVAYQEGNSYCFALMGTALRLLSFTELETMTRHDATQLQ